MTESRGKDTQDEREPVVDPEPIKDLDFDEGASDEVRGGKSVGKSHVPV